MEWSTADIALLRDMAVAGEGEEAVATTLRRRRSDVREMAALLGVSLEAIAKLEWCDRCASPRTALHPETGWCVPCTTRWRLELQRRADEDEERRLLIETYREANVVKKQRERMRAQYGANPRKGQVEPPVDADGS